MDLRLTEDELAFRAEVRAFVRDSLPASIREKTVAGRKLSKDDYVRWTRILAAVQDLRVELVRQAVESDVEWAEWSFTGTKADGSPFAMAGVVIVGVGDGVIRWARFYLEPVDDETGPVSPESTVAAAVSQHLGTS